MHLPMITIVKEDDFFFTHLGVIKWERIAQPMALRFSARVTIALWGRGERGIYQKRMESVIDISKIETPLADL